MVRARVLSASQFRASPIAVQSIAVASNPSMVSIHSIQNGKELRRFPITLPSHKVSVAGIWWFLEEKQAVGNGLPDIFKRGENLVRISVSTMM